MTARARRRRAAWVRRECPFAFHLRWAAAARRSVFRRPSGVLDRMIPAMLRSASLTLLESGKTSFTSGSMTTTFVPWAYWAACLPRTALEKSYSAFIVSTLPCPRYLIVSVLVASLALMIRIRFPRSQYTTTISLPIAETPRETNRSSSGEEWASSCMVISRTSANTVAASSKATPCVRRLRRAFSGFHSKRKLISDASLKYRLIVTHPPSGCQHHGKRPATFASPLYVPSRQRTKRAWVSPSSPSWAGRTSARAAS